MPDCMCEACEEDAERGPLDHDEDSRLAEAADACWNDEWYDYRRDYD